MKDITVVIPYFNGARTIGKALISLASQTKLPAEVIIIVDDQDRTSNGLLSEMIRDLGLSGRIVNQENSGQSSARNLGVFHAKTNLVAFLDQDDEYLPNHCETLSSILESGQFSFVWGDAAIAKPVQGADRGKGIRNKAHFGFPPTISLVLARGAASLPGALMIDKSKFSTNQIFLPELRGFEDDDLVLRLLASKQQGKFTTHVVLRWNQSPSSQSYTLRFALSRLIYWRLVREGIIWKQVGRMAKIIATLRFDYSHANDLKFFLENKNLVHDTDFHSRILCQESTPAGFFISRGVLSPRPLAHRLTLKFLKVANAFLGRLLPESSERKPRLQR